MCNCNKSKFLKEQEAIRILSSIGVKTPLSQIPLLGPILFLRFKMNEIKNKFLFAGDKFMPETHLRQPGFTYRTCGPFTKNKERMKKFKKQEIQDIFIKTN